VTFPAIAEGSVDKDTSKTERTTRTDRPAVPNQTIVHPYDVIGSETIRKPGALVNREGPGDILATVARRTVRTMCPMNCHPTLCGMLVDLAAGREAVGTWSGHGVFANNYGTRVASHLLRRFANLYGCQWWSPTMICWGLGAFGLGLTGLLETNTKEDMGAHSALLVLWGANL